MRSINTSTTLLEQYEKIDTPFMCVDKNKFINNLARLREKTESLGSTLRPHFKTVRALEAAHYLLPEKSSPVTVSTLKEAEALATIGYNNIVYAVGISTPKLHRVQKLVSQGIDLMVLLDSVKQAAELNEFCHENQCTIGALIEVDCDGHRGGVLPKDPTLVEIAQLLYRGPVQFAGILCHAGESYECFDSLSLQNSADNEVKVARLAANTLKKHDLRCKIVSIGSTPTAHSYQDLSGITEVRAGVYSFFDLVMTGIGVCQHSDIAASVVATVIGHNKEKGWVLIDAGWMALSADRGTAGQPKDCGYGLVVGDNGEPIENLQVTGANQEHGLIEAVNGGTVDFSEFPIGCRVQILPNHACAMASMHKEYHVFDIQNETYDIWNRVQGW
ncbi:D-threo-3-hydroxyaspartate dehydratase [Vibrio thalassae]|uniref:D-threo-3-hydroxyaspartate dehydratase n=1 Tax=Vibrio thalassae TaxID=1243014 RepID=A0A240EMH8_9VIBR|nr:alanine racemase [Vibrio thalassae]SNX49170.1 D-threo-3-hydroxyaspartate dehydratase [Vibrio thalassae]